MTNCIRWPAFSCTGAPARGRRTPPPKASASSGSVRPPPSRTLVVSDQMPLNDPFGGWIHWDEIPTLAVENVQLERGGAADLYGSSAIGGVINIGTIHPVFPPRFQLAADAVGAAENSAKGDMLLTAALHPVNLLLAGSGLDTGGYVTTAPALRGAVDTPSGVAEESGRVELRTPTRPDGDTAFLLGNVLNEARGNGTPDQTNGTRLLALSRGR